MSIKNFTVYIKSYRIVALYCIKSAIDLGVGSVVSYFDFSILVKSNTLLRWQNIYYQVF